MQSSPLPHALPLSNLFQPRTHPFQIDSNLMFDSFFLRPHTVISVIVSFIHQCFPPLLFRLKVSPPLPRSLFCLSLCVLPSLFLLSASISLSRVVTGECGRPAEGSDRASLLALPLQRLPLPSSFKQAKLWGLVLLQQPSSSSSSSFFFLSEHHLRSRQLV